MIRHLSGNVCCLLLVYCSSSILFAQQPPAALDGHQSAISAAVYSPDGKLVVTGSFDRTIKIWNAADGAQLKELPGPDGQVLTLAMHPAGRQFVSGSRDNTVKVWDLFIPTPINQFPAHLEKVTAIKTPMLPESPLIPSIKLKALIIRTIVSRVTTILSINGISFIPKIP